MPISASPSNLLVSPSSDGPAFQFGDGQVVNGHASYFDQQAVSGAPSPWTVLQWHKGEYLDPAKSIASDPSTQDPLFGTAAYAWHTDDGESDFRAYHAGAGWVYDLRSRDGALNQDGGANLFLSTDVAPTTLDRKVFLSLDARISEASVYSDAPGARANGTVFAQAFTGVTLNFNVAGRPGYSGDLPSATLFLQLPITDSQGTAGQTAYANAQVSDDGKSAVLIYQGLLPGDRALPFETGSALTSLRYASLNDYVTAAVSRSFPSNHGAFHLPSAALDLSRWTLGSLYVGPETQNSAGGVAEGHAEIGVQIANLSLTLDTPTRPSVGSAPSAATVSLNDAGTASTSQMDAYEGPVDYLKAQYIYGGTGNIVLATETNSAFLRGGPGDDAIQAKGGRNVIDGGAGSNFLTGGSGQDTYFEDLNGQVVWDTIVNFKPGDMVTLWGFKAGQSTDWWDGQSGAVGFQGATMRVAAAGAGDISASVTFTGVSNEAASHLVLSTGIANGTSYLAITNPG